MDTFYLQWHITNKCKNRCKHCYQKEYNGADTPISVAEKVVAEFKNCCQLLNLAPSVALTGGDPFLNPDFSLILKAVREISQRLIVLGNPEPLLQSGNVLLLKGINGYQLSLDGLEEVHDALRYNGSFRATIQAMQVLKQAKIPLAVQNTKPSAYFRLKREPVERLALSGRM